MTLLPQIVSSVSVDGNYATLSAVDVNLSLTEEISTAEGKVDASFSGNWYAVGKTINVYIGREGSTPSTVFVGKISHLEKHYDGHDPVWWEFRARDLGADLSNKYIYGSWRGTIQDIFTTIAAQASFPITFPLTLDTIQAASKSEWESARDVIVDLCDKYDMDFFVDKGGSINLFQRGSLDYNNTFSNVYSFEWEEDMESMINTQDVFGSKNRLTKKDSIMTESSSLWGFYPTTGALVTTTGSLGVDYPIEGSFVVTFSWMTPPTEDYYVERTFSPVEDMRFEGYLEWDMYLYLYGVNWEKVENLHIEVTLYDTDDDYFFTEMSIPSGRQEPLGLIGSWGRWSTGFCNVQLPLALFAQEGFWDESGQPRWSSIGKIRVKIKDPAPQYSAILHVDDMKYSSGLNISTTFDTTSINTYGVKRGKPVFDSNLMSTIETQAVADKIISLWKDPIRSVTSVKTAGNTSIGVGEVIEFNLVGESATANVRRIEHHVEDGDWSTTYSLSKRYMPTLDRILLNFRKKIDKAEYELRKDKLPPTVLSAYASEGIAATSFMTDFFSEHKVFNDAFVRLDTAIWEQIKDAGTDITIGLLNGIPNLELRTPTDNSAGFVKLIGTVSPNNKWGKNDWRFQTEMWMAATISVAGHAFFGVEDGTSSSSTLGMDYSIFWLQGDSLGVRSASSGSDTSSTWLIGTITSRMKYSIQKLGSGSGSTLIFQVNNVPRYTITSNVPTGNMGIVYAMYYPATPSNYNTMYVRMAAIQEEVE